MITVESKKIPEVLPNDEHKPKLKLKVNLYSYTMPQLMTYYECRELYYQRHLNETRNYNNFLNILRKEFKKRFNCDIYGRSLSDNNEDDN